MIRRLVHRFALLLWPVGDELLVPSRRNQVLQPLGFECENSFTEWSETEILPPAVGRRGVLRLLGLGNQCIVVEAPQSLVETSGGWVEPASRTLLDLLTDGISKRGAVSQSEKYVEGQVGQRHITPRFT